MIFMKNAEIRGRGGPGPPKGVFEKILEGSYNFTRFFVIWELESGTWDSGFRIWDSVSLIWDLRIGKWI